MGETWRIGEGYDLHRLETGLPLRIGCVEIDADFGAVGHSDADVLAHAVCDAIFGALAAGDIGTHFPPGDPRWKGADSRVFLAKAAGVLADRGGRLLNLDATVVLEAPKLAPHIPTMRERLAAALGCDVSAVSVKAKTAEGTGEVGAGRAIEARAVALVALTP